MQANCNNAWNMESKQVRKQESKQANCNNACHYGGIKARKQKQQASVKASRQIARIHAIKRG